MLTRARLRRAAAAIVGLYVVYLVGANLFLNVDRLNSLISPRPEKTLVEWKSGWTLFPGFIHVEGLRIRGQSRSSSRRSSTATSIHPPRKQKKRRWQVDISDVDLRGPVEVWLGGLRTMGMGRIGGDVKFQLGGEMSVPEALFDLVDARVTALGDTLAQRVKLDADLRALNAFIPGGAGIEALEGEGLLNLSLAKDNLEQGGYGDFALEVDGARLRLNEEQISGDLDIEMRLNGGGLSLGWYEISDTTISFENAVLTDRQSEAADTWWGRLRVKDGRFVFSKPVDVDVVVEFDVQDTAPLLNAFLAKPKEGDEGMKKVPKWIKPRRWFLEQPEFDDSTQIAPPAATEGIQDGAGE